MMDGLFVFWKVILVIVLSHSAAGAPKGKGLKRLLEEAAKGVEDARRVEDADARGAARRAGISFERRSALREGVAAKQIERKGLKRGGIRDKLREGVVAKQTSAMGSGEEADARKRLKAATSEHQFAQNIRESVEHTDSAGSRPDIDPTLRDSLRRDWGKGEISARKVQEYAMGAARAGAGGLDDLALAGTSGKNTQNIQRSLLGIFGRPQGAPPIDWVEIPVKGGRMVSHPFIFPHKFFRSMFLERFDLFTRHVVGPEGAAREFWEAIEHLPFVSVHPKIRANNYDRIAPIGFHGDAGAFSKSDNLMILSWNGLLARGRTRMKRFVFTFVRKRDYTPATLDRIFELLAWSFNAMADGLAPHESWDRRKIGPENEPLAGGWQAILTQIRGDWQFYCEIFSFPAWNAAERMCWRCRASTTNRDLKWVDTTEKANWRRTRFSHEDYLEWLRVNGLAIPILLALVIGLRLECISIDSLHVMDLGLAAHVVANTLWETVLGKKWGHSTQDKNVEALERDMKTWGKANKVTTRIQGQLTKERICPKDTGSGYPKLRAKGAATRKLAEYSLELARRFNTGSTHDLLRLGVNETLCRYYNVLSTQGQFLDDDAKNTLYNIGLDLGNLYSSLYTEAFKKGVKLWKMIPKLHLMQELTMYQAQDWGNPAYYWCYPDEDLVGLMVEIAKSCHVNTLAFTALVKWLVVAFEALPENNDD